MWILQELHDLDGVNASTRATIMDHMKLTGEWGADFTGFYHHTCNASTNRTGLPNCFPTTSCNSDRVRMQAAAAVDTGVVAPSLFPLGHCQMCAVGSLWVALQRDSRCPVGLIFVS